MFSNLQMPASNFSHEPNIVIQGLAVADAEESNSIPSSRNMTVRSYDSFNNVSENNHRDKSLRSVATAATYDLTPSPMTASNLDNHNKKISIEQFQDNSIPTGAMNTNKGKFPSFAPPLTTTKYDDDQDSGTSGSDSFLMGDDSIDTFSFGDSDDNDDEDGDAIMFDVTRLPMTDTTTVTRMNVTKALRGVIRQEYCARKQGLDPILSLSPGSPTYMRSLRTTDMRTAPPSGSVSASSTAASSSAIQQGTFTKLSEVLFLGRRNNTTDMQPQQQQQRYYACKSLNATGVGARPLSFIQGVALLAYEARVLSSLQHPNVIQIHGWGNTKNNDASASSSSRLTGFFFVQDQIVETLDARIAHWSTMTPCDGLTSASTTLEVASWSNYPREPSSRRGTLRDHFAYHFRQIEKYCLCQDLGAALQYLHTKQIVYTNLSPRTIGFIARKPHSISPLGGVGGGCSTETLKLIDFESSHTVAYGRKQNNTNYSMLYSNQSNITQTMLSQSASVAGNNKNSYNYMSPEAYRSNNFSTNQNKTTNRTIPTKQPNTM